LKKKKKKRMKKWFYLNEESPFVVGKNEKGPPGPLGPPTRSRSISWKNRCETETVSHSSWRGPWNNEWMKRKLNNLSFFRYSIPLFINAWSTLLLDRYITVPHVLQVCRVRLGWLIRLFLSYFHLFASSNSSSACMLYWPCLDG
jgi:hypothetical protein